MSPLVRRARWFLVWLVVDQALTVYALAPALTLPAHAPWLACAAAAGGDVEQDLDSFDPGADGASPYAGGADRCRLFFWGYRARTRRPDPTWLAPSAFAPALPPTPIPGLSPSVRRRPATAALGVTLQVRLCRRRC